MLGSFFGVTGVNLVALDMQKRQFGRLTGMLNNRMDSELLKKAQLELQYLDYFLRERIDEDYDSAEIKKMLRQAKLLRARNSDSLRRVYKVEIEGRTPEEIEAMAVQVETLAKDMAELKGVQRQITNSFKLYNSEAVISLGENSLKTLKYFKDNYHNTVEKYLDWIIVGNFSEQTVFGRKLHQISQRSPRNLLNVVAELFLQPGVNKQALAAQCLEWVNIMRSHFEGEGSNLSQEREDLTGFMKLALSAEIRLGELEEKDPDMTGTNSMTNRREYLLDMFEQVSGPFKEVLGRLVGDGLLGKVEITTLVDLYFSCFQLDYDPAFVTNRLLGEGHDALDWEELELIYKSLNQIGFYFFHRKNEAMFVETLKKLSFSKQTKTVIRQNEVIGGYSFARVLEDIEYFCLSIQPLAG